MGSADEEGFRRNLVVSAHFQQPIDRHISPTDSAKATERHQKFSCGYIAEGLKLPLVRSRFPLGEAVAHYSRTIGKKRVSNFVSEREPDSSRRSVRIELNAY